MPHSKKLQAGRHSLRLRGNAGLAAIKVVDEFEKRELGRLSRQDREALKLLRNEEWREILGSAWLEIEPFFKNAFVNGPTEYSAADQVIHAIIYAMRQVKTATKRRGEWHNRVKEFEKVRKAIDLLERFNTQHPSYGLLDSGQSQHIAPSLSLLRTRLDAVQGVESVERHRIPRIPKMREWIVFSNHMVWTMGMLFGKPCYVAASCFTQVVFQTTEFTSRQARDAYRDHGMPVFQHLDKQPFSVRHRWRKLDARPSK
jgi:hypothetical protein